jgi:hypothetical protein
MALPVKCCTTANGLPVQEEEVFGERIEVLSGGETFVAETALSIAALDEH